MPLHHDSPLRCSSTYTQYPCVEILNNYHPSGFHPHLHDTFKNRQYTVVHKLRYGSYSTVWLVMDSSTGKYASLNILATDASKWPQGSSDLASSNNETDVLLRLHSEHGDDEGQNHVVAFLDHLIMKDRTASIDVLLLKF